MTIRNCILLIGLGITIIISGCGPSKKLKAAQAENAQLNSSVADLTSKNEDLKKQLADITARDEKLATELKRYVAECQQSKEKLEVVQTALKEQYESMQAMKAKIAEALVDFNNKGVDVYYKEGLVYVSIEDQLLYKSGSASLGKEAKAALAPLATVLNTYPDLKVIVLGNTDDTKFKKGSDNWSLSTERANGVVRALRDDYNVDPMRLTAAGKGKYNPVADNSTAEGKAKNRRTEIILNPNLQKIWESVQQ
jgi:chemotaxis protein MotB